MYGKTPAFVVVDDPYGYVVPSLGVEIVGRIGHLSRSVLGLDLLASQVINMGPDRAVERKAKAIEPTIKYRSKPKQRFKGLRP